MPETSDIAAGRLSPARIAENFADAHPPLTPHEAVVEASRCYFCYDAPCIEACPTGIDIPSFIKKIATGNLRGSALKIFEQNIFGGSCARVCPTEELCESACVRMAEEERPVRIGALQRRATDWLMEHDPAVQARARDRQAHRRRGRRTRGSCLRASPRAARAFRDGVRGAAEARRPQ